VQARQFPVATEKGMTVPVDANDVRGLVRFGMSSSAGRLPAARSVLSRDELRRTGMTLPPLPTAGSESVFANWLAAIGIAVLEAASATDRVKPRC
jgi:hypothetical protein